MKRIALLTGALCAISAGVAVAQQNVVTIPFQQRFGDIHRPIPALNTVERGGSQSRSFREGTSPNPADRGVVTSPTAGAPRRGQLDPTVMNIPVFPGNPFAPGAVPQPGFGTFSPYAIGVGGVGGPGGVIMQQGAGGSTLQQVDPFRTTATPGPAFNAQPNPAVNAAPTPAAPVPTTPQLIPSTPTPGAPLPPSTTIPVQQQTPPGTAIQGPQGNPPQGGAGQNPNR